MPTTTAQLPNLTSAERLDFAVKRSQRTTQVSFPVPFVRTEDPDIPTPMVRMVRGGRGGEIRLKAYLTITLLATSHPFDIRRRIPARVWAEMLALPKPDTLGARRIADALDWLDVNSFVRLERQAGSPPKVYLLSASGSGGDYSRPRGRYVGLPLDFWRKQWITHLSGSAIALLLVLLDLQGGLKGPNEAPSLPGERRRRYSLSDDTWARAIEELKSFGVLTVGRVSQGRDLDWTRMQNTYWIDKNVLSGAPQKLPVS